MPPKKPPVRKGAAKKVVPAAAGPSGQEDSKPVVEQVLEAETVEDTTSDALNEQQDVKPALDSTNGAAQPVAATSPPTSTAPETRPRPTSTSTPSAPSVQRLDSLDRPPSNSSTRGKPAIARPKFAGRRSATARLEIERQEAEKARLKAEAEDKERKRREKRGPFRGKAKGSGRGGYIGENDRRGPPQDAVASGPFSMGQVLADEKARAKRRAPGGIGGGITTATNNIESVGREVGPRTGEGTSGGTTFGTGTASGGASGGTSSAGTGGVKLEPGTFGQTPAKVNGDGDVDMSLGPYVKTEDGGYISSDDEEERRVERRNVDDLKVVDLTGDDESDIQLSQIFAPVRLKREAHKERTLGMKGEGAEGSAIQADEDHKEPQVSERRKGKQRAKDVEITGEQRGFTGAWQDSASDAEPEPRIKTEPTEDDRPATPQQMPAPTAQMVPQSPPTSPESKRKAKERIKARVSSHTLEPPDYQLQEEKAEWDLHQRDLKMLRDELGTPAPTYGAEIAVDGAGEVKDPRQGKVYLFQFPPVLPDLEPVTVKPDPDAPQAQAGANGDAMDVDRPTNSALNPVNVEDGEAGAKASQPKLPSGAVGKLRIHASGRATLDWGGTSLEMGMGTEASFLQDVLIADLKKSEKGDYQGGTAMSMGQVKGKFVVTPNWEEILK